MKYVKGPKGVASQIAKRFLLQQSVAVLKTMGSVSSTVHMFHEEVLSYPLVKRSVQVWNAHILGCGRLFLCEDERKQRALEKLGVDAKNFTEFKRAVIGKQVIESAEYNRPKRRNNGVVQLVGGRFMSILHICHDQVKGICVAIGRPFKIIEEENSSGMCVPYMRQYVYEDSVVAFSMDDIEGKCILIANEHCIYISKLPNVYENE
jgi:hypothetical protein